MPQALSIISYINSPKTLSKKRKKYFRKINKISIYSFILSVLILGCFILYLYMNLQLVEMNFNLREKEKGLTALENETKQLESQIGNVFSVEEIEKKVQKLKLTKADDVRYLKLKATPSLSLEE